MIAVAADDITRPDLLDRSRRIDDSRDHAVCRLYQAGKGYLPFHPDARVGKRSLEELLVHVLGKRERERKRAQAFADRAKIDLRHGLAANPQADRADRRAGCDAALGQSHLPVQLESASLHDHGAGGGRRGFGLVDNAAVYPGPSQP